MSGLSVGCALPALVASLLAIAPVARADEGAPKPAAAPPSIGDASLPPALRVVAGREELSALRRRRPVDRKRVADVAKQLGDLLGDLDDAGRAEHHEEAIRDYSLALGYYKKATAPREWAELNNDLAVEYRARERGDGRRNAEMALAAHRAALTVYTRERDPDRWALVQSDLCVVLRDRQAGSRAANVEAAVTACKLALTVRTQATAPEGFATTSENLALALAARRTGSERERVDAQIAALEDALTGRSRPADATRVRLKAGILYAKRGEDLGGPATDLDRAIDLLSVALSTPAPGSGLEERERAHVEQELGRAYHARMTGDRAADVERALEAYREASAHVTRDGDREAWASLQVDVGNALQDRVLGDRAENVEGALDAYQRALAATSVRDDPDDWASLQNNVGTALDARIRGTRRDNLRRAVAAYKEAIRVGRRVQSTADLGDYLDNLGVAYGHLAEEDPGTAERAISSFREALALQRPWSPAWGETQNNLGTVLLRRQRGGAAANVDAALDAFRLAVRSRRRDLDPMGWAESTDNVGNALFERVRGDRAENLEASIRAFEDALAVRTHDAAPRAWAATQSNLGEALVDRVRGDRGENVQRAVEAYLAALTVYTETSDPATWSAIEDNLGNAYRASDRGDGARNNELAIQAFEASLRVRKRTTMPMAWAGTMNDLAIAYGARGTAPSRRVGDADVLDGVRAGREVDRRADLDEAVAAHEATLRVWTRKTTPVDWAMALNNLGALLADPDYRDREAGTERAIDCYRRALLVRTRAALPQDWADTRNNMGLAYMSRVRGDRGTNVELAIANYRAALEVRTRRGDPLGFVATERALAAAYSRRSTGDPASNQRSATTAYASAMDAVDDLVGDGLDPRRTMVAMRAAGELFRSAALQAARQGRLGDSLAIAERGRTRVLQLALRLDEEGQALAPEARERLQALRTALREAEAQVDRSAPTSGDAVPDPVGFAEGQGVARSRAAALRSEIAAILPPRPPATVQPVPPDRGAIVVPLVAREGALALLVTADGLSTVEMPDLDDRRLNRMFLGSEGRFGSGGWSKAYQSLVAGNERATPSQDWRDSMSGFQVDAWALFGRPLIDGLRRAGVGPGASLVLIAEDYLARMPLWLARDPGSGTFLADLYRVTSAPNLASLSVPARTGQEGVAAWFNEAAFPELQYTALARRLVAVRGGATDIVPGEQGKNASTLIARLEGHSRWLLWTHGRFDARDPRGSFLELEGAGGPGAGPQLSVGTLLEAKFGPRGPDLVILSACESGLADVSQDDELVGLPTALLQAGARGVVSAMWPVREDATALLMGRFVELLRERRLRPSEALGLAASWLRSATAAELIAYVDASHPDLRAGSELAKGYSRMMDVLQEGDASERPFADPYFWAAFSFTGVD